MCHSPWLEQQVGELIDTAPGAINPGWGGGVSTAIAANERPGMTRLRTVNNKGCHAN
jgi:hypothetical protein